MSNENEAKLLQNYVRDFYKSSLKSFNKSYDADLATADKVAKAKHRHQELAKLTSQRQTIIAKTRELSENKKINGQPDNTIFDRALLEDQFYQENPQQIYGNCIEMTNRVFLFAKQRNVKWVWLCGFGGFSYNHVFAIIGKIDLNSYMFYQQIARSTIDPYDPPWVVDPWSNICCRLNDYPAAINKKMLEWQAQGKIIKISSLNSLQPVEYLEMCLQQKSKLQIKLVIDEHGNT